MVLYIHDGAFQVEWSTNELEACCKAMQNQQNMLMHMFYFDGWFLCCF